jgi:hypothetical protein
MADRSKLKLLGYIAVGAVSSFALMAGGNAYAFGLSTEDLIKKFMEVIIRAVSNESYEIFEETFENYEKQMKKVYSDDSDHVAKKAAADAQMTQKAITVEEQIYNQNAISDSMDIRTACRAPTGPLVDDAEERIGELQAAMSYENVSAPTSPQKQQEAGDRIERHVLAFTANPEKLPPSLSAETFLTDYGYINKNHASAAREYFHNLMGNAKDDKLAALRGLQSLNPEQKRFLSNECAAFSETMLANSVLDSIYLHRVRDKGIAQRLIANTTDVEASILKIHANEFGMSLIDLYNYEAEIAAHNYEYTKDIMTSTLEDDQENLSAVPSLVRAVKYMVQTKAVEEAFLVRINEQNAMIAKLHAVIAKQNVSQDDL